MARLYKSIFSMIYDDLPPLQIVILAIPCHSYVKLPEGISDQLDSI